MSESFVNEWRPRVLSLLRIVAALLFMEHGLQKFFGFPLPAPASLPPLELAAGTIELVGSALLLLGLFTRFAAFIMSGEMAVGYFLDHLPRSFYPIANGGESAVLFCFVFLYIAVAGGGPFSIDSARRRV